ncbi:MAG TPA: hypothetical protein VK053_01115 [Jiangellaceae bacterium]|nr:hypothetical protein [Jiangellaceae bacterium]
MSDLEQLRGQWQAALERIEDGYADALENGAPPDDVSVMAGMIAAYRRIITDTKR